MNVTADKLMNRARSGNISEVCVTFLCVFDSPDQTRCVTGHKLTSLLGPELQGDRPSEDTHPPLRRRNVWSKPALGHLVLHLRHWLHHGPAMFRSSGSVHRDWMYVNGTGRNGRRLVTLRNKELAVGS